MAEPFHDWELADDRDPRERPEEKQEMEAFAEAIIGPNWREEVTRSQLVDFWIWHGGEKWRNGVTFLQEFYRQQKVWDDEDASDADIPENELRTLGMCIEPTEELHASCKRFYEDAEKDAIAKGETPQGIPSYEEFVNIVAQWKAFNPAELYCKARTWQTGYAESVQQIHDEVSKSCDRVLSFFRKRMIKDD